MDAARDNSTEDEPLLARSVHDADAFALFYAAYVERVSVYFLRRVFDPETAVDLTAETFARALERRRQFRGATAAKEQGWLFKIAERLLADYWRRGQVERAALHRARLERPPLGTEDIDYLIQRAGLDASRQDLSAALAQLEPRYARAVQARIIDGREYADIARDFSASHEAVRQHVSRGLHMLQRILGSGFRDELHDE